MKPVADSMPALAAAILARTSGPACGRLRTLACDFADGRLPAGDADLVRRHLEHCPACQSLVARLRAATLLLPAFASLDPGPGFTALVLGRTRPAAAPTPDPLLDGWTRLMQRPRAALEAAYLATAAGLILTQIPLPTALRAVPATLVTRVRAEARDSLTQIHAQGATWTHRTRSILPVRAPGPPPSAWAALWSRLDRLRHRTWLVLTRALQQLRFRAHPAGPGTPPTTTEPAPATLRSAL